MNQIVQEPILSHKTVYSGEPIGVDPRLEGVERETCLNFSDASGIVQMNTHCTSLILALLRCSFVQVDEIEIYNPVGCVSGLSCSFQIGALGISSPRADSRPSRVVSRSSQSRSSIVKCAPRTHIRSAESAQSDPALVETASNSTPVACAPSGASE